MAFAFLGTSEDKSVIGLEWTPEVPNLLGGMKHASEKSQTEVKHSDSKPSNELVHSLYVSHRNPGNMSKLLKKNMKDAASSRWFDISAPSITPELKKDLELLELGHVIDLTRHFKKADKPKTLPKYFQIGTVVEPASELFGRLIKKERKTTLADELLHDNALNTYR